MRSFFRLLTLALALLVPQASSASTITIDAPVCLFGCVGPQPQIRFTGTLLHLEGVLERFFDPDFDGTGGSYHFVGQVEIDMSWDDDILLVEDQGRFIGTFDLTFELHIAIIFAGIPISGGPGFATMEGQLDPNLAEALGVPCCFASGYIDFFFDGFSGNPSSDFQEGIGFPREFSFFGLGDSFDYDEPFAVINGPAVPEPSVMSLLLVAPLIGLRLRRHASRRG